MNFIDIILLCIALVSAAVLLFFSFKMKHPFKNIILSVLISWVTWGVINNTTFLTGVYIPLNLYTLIASSVYGLPGISGLIALSAIFGL